MSLNLSICKTLYSLAPERARFSADRYPVVQNAMHEEYSMVYIGLGEGNSADKIGPYGDREENIDGNDQETEGIDAGHLHTDMSMRGFYWFPFYTVVNPHLVCDA